MRYPRCILGTCCLPWKDDFTLDEELFIGEIEHSVRHGTKHLYIFGTAGEGYAVSDTQFREITSLFVDTIRGLDAVPMVGVISLSLNTVIERIEYCVDSGVDEIQISLPSWGACSDREVSLFFRETCGRFPDCRFLHYNVARAKRRLTPDDYHELEAEYPNLVATKSGDDSMGHLNRLFTKAPRLRHFLTESAFGAAGLAGYDAGLLISLSSMNWSKALEFYAAVVNGVQTDTVKILKELVAIREILGRALGDLPHMDGAFDKVYCKVHEPRYPLRLLPPYIGTSDGAFEAFTGEIRTRFPGWIP